MGILPRQNGDYPIASESPWDSNRLVEATLVSLGISNFKAFKSAQIPLRPLTLIYGQNSAGKSSVIDALALSASFVEAGIGREPLDESPLTVEISGNRIRLGRYGDYVHGKKSARPLSLTYTFRDTPLSLALREGISLNKPVNLDSVQCRAEFSKRGLQRFSIIVGNYPEPILELAAGPNLFSQATWNFQHPELLGYTNQVIEQWKMGLTKPLLKACGIEFDEGGGNQSARELIHAVFSEAQERLSRRVIYDHAKLPPVRYPLILTAEVPFGREFNFDDCGLPETPAETVLQAIVRDGVEFLVDALDVKYDRLTQYLRTMFSGAAYLGPVREYLETDQLLSLSPAAMKDEPRAPPTSRGWMLNRDAVKYVNRWLRGRRARDTNYQLEYAFLRPGKRQGRRAQRIRLMDRNRNIEVGFHEVGSGIGQFLPVLLAAAADNPMVLVKQPELHLHPALQADIADCFLECALKRKSGKMIIMETHSEHLLLRIMKRIRQTNAGTLPRGLPGVSATDVSVVYVENLGMESLVREMPLNERGELVRDWPGGFFEEGLREMLL